MREIERKQGRILSSIPRGSERRKRNQRLTIIIAFVHRNSSNGVLQWCVCAIPLIELIFLSAQNSHHSISSKRHVLPTALFGRFLYKLSVVDVRSSRVTISVYCFLLDELIFSPERIRRVVLERSRPILGGKQRNYLTHSASYSLCSVVQTRRITWCSRSRSWSWFLVATASRQNDDGCIRARHRPVLVFVWLRASH